MANAHTQFTPSQILEAGQRAEADGRIDHARQFYRHLVDHYAGAPEFAAAQAGLSRLGHPVEDLRTAPPSSRSHMARAHEPAFDQPSRRAPHDAPSAPPQFHGPEQPGPSFDRVTPSRSAPSASSDDFRRPVHGHRGHQGVQIAPAGYEIDDYEQFDEDIMRPRAGYRFGRILAGFITVFGILAMLAGTVVTIVMFVMPAVLQSTAGTPGILGIIASSIFLAAGPGLVLAGFVLCFASQVARAIFNAADASTQLRDMQLARIADRHPQSR